MTTATIVHPDVVLKSLIDKGCRSDKAGKLKKLHELCFLEYKRHSQGARDLSIANIARIAESHGLFRARTIYNSQSDDYASLIRAWSAYNGPKASNVTKAQSTPTGKNDFLKAISDPALRTLCQIAFSERDKLRAELNMLKAKTKLIVDMRPKSRSVIENSDTVVEEASKFSFTNSERSALVKAVDPKVLAEKGWRLGEAGEVIDSRGRFIFHPGFATAIGKILEENQSTVA